jgi:hypothetical protein
MIREGVAMTALALAPSFPIYLQARIGGTTRDQLERELARNGYVGDCARNMMARPDFTTTASRRLIRIVRVQLRELGFTDWAFWADIMRTVREAGGVKLPAEAGPRIWLDLPQQEPGEHFWFLMDPIADALGDPFVFYAACNDDGERRLLGRYLAPGRRFFPHREILFGLRD